MHRYLLCSSLRPHLATRVAQYTTSPSQRTTIKRLKRPPRGGQNLSDRYDRLKNLFEGRKPFPKRLMTSLDHHPESLRNPGRISQVPSEGSRYPRNQGHLNQTNAACRAAQFASTTYTKNP